MNKQSAFIKEESHEKIVKENEEEKLRELKKELKRKRNCERQRAYYQRQKNLKKNEEKKRKKKVPKTNAERQREFRQRNKAEKSYVNKKRRKLCNSKENVVQDRAVENIENVTLQENQFYSQHLHIYEQLLLRNAGIPGDGFVTNTQFEQHECKAQSSPEAEDQQPQPQEAKKENKLPEELLEVEMKIHQKSPDGPSFVMVQDEQNIPTPMRVFVCRYCQKPFKRRDHYKIHLNIHTGIRSFFCPDCGKGFYRKDHLQKHSQTHRNKPKPKKQLPGLVPISFHGRRQEPEPKPEVKPEITIHAPPNSKLRVPLQIKVPYQMVVSGRVVPRREVLT